MLHMQNRWEDSERSGYGQGKGRQREMNVVWLQEVDRDLKIATLPAQKKIPACCSELPPPPPSLGQRGPALL